MTYTDPRVRRAVAQIDQYTDLFPRLMRTLDNRIQFTREMIADLGVDYDTWRAMDSFEDREAVLVRHTDEIIPVVRRHAGLTVKEWRALSFNEKWDLVDRWRAEVRDVADQTA